MCIYPFSSVLHKGKLDVESLQPAEVTQHKNRDMDGPLDPSRGDDHEGNTPLVRRVCPSSAEVVAIIDQGAFMFEWWSRRGPDPLGRVLNP